jgi:hypothetical protein
MELLKKLMNYVESKLIGANGAFSNGCLIRNIFKKIQKN